MKAYQLNKLKHPEIFQGNKKRRQYFEGWYFKMVSSNDSSILSVIPGISLSQNGKEEHAFIQIIDGKTAKTNYYNFSINEFYFSEKEFAIRIGDNYFSKDLMILNIHQDSSIVMGTIQMSQQVQMNSTRIFNSSIMSWYRFVPFMQCYHGVVSLTHHLKGQIVKNNTIYQFNRGKGYIEKDWGSSMPSAWIWMQSNNFSKSNHSFMLSIANVPWLGRSFTGFLGFFLQDSIIHHFATYTHAKLKIKTYNLDTVKIEIKNKKYIYSILALRCKSGLLKAPVKGSMERRIAESVAAKIVLSIRDKKQNILFTDSSKVSGLEIVGDEPTLIKGLKK